MDQSERRLLQLETYVRDLKGLRPRVARNSRLAGQLERSIEIGESMISCERKQQGSATRTPATSD